MSTLQFDGIKDYVEIADDAGLSVATTGSLTVAAWIRPDVLTFPNSESTGYVHWMGKGDIGEQEWTFRMYNETTTDVPPPPSFYVFNPQPGKGVGSYFQEPIQPGEWIHVAGITDGQNISMYKNGRSWAFVKRLSSFMTEKFGTSITLRPCYPHAAPS
jgi:Concanavalin A-like lectin/glucanases superfamily